MNKRAQQSQLVEITADIVSAYVSKNRIPMAELARLIADTYGSVSALGTEAAEPALEPAKPAVPIKQSVKPDFIVCLEDGKKFKSMKRHLDTHFGMTPDQYRAKWNLPADYPMVAPNYAAQRSAMAKQYGLGRKAQVAPVKKPRRAGAKSKSA